jgi:pimeloyl-ACP methyl ester carboxylesterase
MNEDSKVSGHPRTRGARSFYQREKNLGGGYPIRFGSVPAFDGTPIFYCVEGEGEPLVFCYGIACSSLHWTYQIDYFRKNYQCIWFDYRGHRHTPIPDHLDTLNVESCTRDLKSVLDFLDVKKATLLGHSMGVSVVLDFAHRHPERVKGLVLANGTPKRPLETLLGGNFLVPAFGVLSKFEKEKPSLIGSLWKLQEKTQMIGNALGVLGFNRALTDPEDIKTYARQIAELPPTVLTRMMDDYQSFDATPWLHEVQARTLILSGDSDLVTPPHTQDLMAQLMRNAELHRIQHGSHCSTLDLPDYVNLLIERFLTKNVE